MPKKTKKQKILAQLHRKLQLSQIAQSQDFKLNVSFVKGQNNLPTNDKSDGYKLSPVTHKEAVTKGEKPQGEANYAYIRNDLFRITIFTLFALILQGVLYFLLRTR